LVGCALLVLAGCVCLFSGMNPGFMDGKPSPDAEESAPTGAVPQATPVECGKKKAPDGSGISEEVCPESPEDSPRGSP
jgi:hypothetical protein